MKDVSIVLITWKMEDQLEKLLDSLIKHSTGFSYEIIVVDNNSQDGTIEMLNEKFPDVVQIRNKHNMGVAPARNQGMKIAAGAFILILDADMIIKENSVLKLLNFMRDNENCGLAAAKLEYQNGDLQYSCKKFPTILSLLGRRLEGLGFVKNSKLLRNHLMSDWDHNEVSEVDYVIGACQMIRKEVVAKIGYYDDKIFYGPEDIDFCIRVWRAGWKVIYYPLTSIVHFEQRITKKALLSKITFRHVLGIYYIFKKYKGRLTR